MKEHGLGRQAFFAALLALLIVAITACGRPDDLDADTTISGRIYDSATLAPIPGAIVGTEPASSQVRSNEEGLYRITTGLVSGTTYRVSASKSGYRDNSATVLIGEGRNHEVDLALEQAGPLLAIDQESLQFGGRLDSRQLLIENQGTGTLSYEVFEAPERWVILEGASVGTVTDTSRSVTVRVNRTGLERGSYNTTLQIASNGGSVTVAIHMEVLGPNEPRLSIDPLSLDFGSETTTLTLHVENLGTGLLEWEVKEGATWLSASPRHGETATGPDRITVTARREGQSGERKSLLTVFSNDRTVTLPVSMKAESGGGGGGTFEPPSDFVEGTVQRSIPTPGERPQGLAHDGRDLWVGDLREQRVFQISKVDGSVLTSHALPQEDLIDISHTSGALFLAFGGNKLYKMDPRTGEAEQSTLRYEKLRGVTTDSQYVLTWEGNLLKRRNPSSLNPAFLANLSQEGRHLALASGNLFLAGQAKLDGSLFVVPVRMYDASTLSAVHHKKDISIPADLGTITGATAHGNTLWLTGTGYGKNAEHIVEVQLR